MNLQEEPLQGESNVTGCDTESQTTTKSESFDTALAPTSGSTACPDAPLVVSTQAASSKTAGLHASGERVDPMGASPPPTQQEEAPAHLTRAESARRNGAKSHGPRTEQGKERSRQNAVKHGLAARTLLRALATEDQQAFEDVLEGLRASHLPRGYEQCQLVELAALELWRLAQAARLEARDFSHQQIFSYANPDRLSRYHSSAWKRYSQILERLEKLQALAQASGVSRKGERGVENGGEEGEEQ